MAIIIFAIFTFVYIFKYFVKLNFHFTKSYLMYGLLYIIVLGLCIVTVSIKYSILGTLHETNYFVNYETVLRLYACFNLFRISFYWLTLVISIEIIKLFVFIKRLAMLRTSVIVLYRTFPVGIKCLLLYALVVICASLPLLSFDGILGIKNYASLLFDFQNQPMTESTEQTAILILSTRQIL